MQREVTARSHHHHADSFSFAGAPGTEGNDTNARSLLFSEWLHKKAPQRAAWKKRWCAVEAVRVCGAACVRRAQRAAAAHAHRASSLARSPAPSSSLSRSRSRRAPQGHGVATLMYSTCPPDEGGRLKGSFVLGLGTGRARAVGVEAQSGWRPPTPFCFTMTGTGGREWVFAAKSAALRERWVQAINRARVDHGLAT